MVKKYVFNSLGEKELFSPLKVYWSARRAGASKPLAEKIIAMVESKTKAGTRTLEIYDWIKQILKQENPSVNLRFSLKTGMRKLGPSGFPFEKFVGEIFSRLGYKVSTNVYLSGFCLKDYEIDFLARKGQLVYVGECKYRNLAGDKVHLDNVLANQARFLDLLKGPDLNLGQSQVKSIMVTNEKFTSRAISYSHCQRIELLGWKYPLGNGLEKTIEGNGFYPVTILPSLKGHLQDVLVAKQMMMAKDLLETDIKVLAQKLKIPLKYLYSIVKEAELLFQKA